MKRIILALCLCFAAAATSAETIVRYIFCDEGECRVVSNKPINTIRPGSSVFVGIKCSLTERDFFRHNQECVWKGKLVGRNNIDIEMLPGGGETEPQLRWNRILLLSGLGLILLAALLFIPLKSREDKRLPYHRRGLRVIRLPFGLGIACFVLALFFQAIDGILFGQMTLIWAMAIPAFLFAAIIAVDRFDYMNNGYAFRSEDFWKRFNAYLLWALVATYFI